MAKTLENAQYLSFSTFRKNGNTVATPVWFARNGNSIYLFSDPNAGKIKRLKNFSKSQVAPCDVRGKVLGDWSNTEAFIINAEEEKQAAYQALSNKYGWQMKVLDLFSWLGQKIDKRIFIKVELQTN